MVGDIKGEVRQFWEHTPYIESLGTKAYTVCEARNMFSGLAEVKVTPVVTPYDVRLTRSRYLPRWVQSLIPRRLGWFLVVQGKKVR